jgi:hypothetical protein
MRPGLGSVPNMQLIYGDLGNAQANPSAADNPKIQQVAALPSGTSAPNTVIASHAFQEYKLQTSLAGRATLLVRAVDWILCTCSIKRGDERVDSVIIIDMIFIIYQTVAQLTVVRVIARLHTLRESHFTYTAG